MKVFSRALRQWLYTEDSWTIIVGLGLSLLMTVLFLLLPSEQVQALAEPIPVWSSWDTISYYLIHHLPKCLLVYIILLMTTSLSFKGMGLIGRRFVAGFTLLFFFALLSKFLGSNLYLKDFKLEGSILALFVGFFIGNVFKLPSWFRVTMRPEYFLKIGIILLGASLPITMILSAGPIAIGQSVLISTISFTTVYLVGSKGLGLD